MKALLLSMTVLLSASSLHAQTLIGVAISGRLQTCMAGFEKQGFRYVKDNPHGVTMSGKMYDRPVELYIVVTPRSKTVCKVSLYFPKRQSWSALMNEYEQLRHQLTKALGTPDQQEATFQLPFKSGDGRELEALRSEKCSYSTIWLNKGNTHAILEISEFLQVYMAVENRENMELWERERDGKILNE